MYFNGKVVGKVSTTKDEVAAKASGLLLAQPWRGKE